MADTADEREFVLLEALTGATAIAEPSARHLGLDLLDGDLETAELIISGDEEIDQRAVDVEEHCMQILALQAPVAGDLRTILAAQIQEHERSVGVWGVEWLTFPALSLVTSGALATIANLNPKNLVIVVWDNGMYQITGSQPAATAVGTPR